MEAEEVRTGLRLEETAIALRDDVVAAEAGADRQWHPGNLAHLGSPPGTAVR